MEKAKAEGQPERAEPSKEDRELADEMFAKLIDGKSITEVVKTNRGDFEIRYPLGRDFVEIDRRKAIMRGSIPAEQFDRAADSNMEAYASLDVLVVKSPEWWSKLASSADCPDPALIKELYRGYLRFCTKVQGLLQFASSGGSGETSSVQPEIKAVGGGLFQGLAFGTRKDKR